MIRSKRSVLIVDDVDEMREMLETLVNGIEGYAVSATCANCMEARLEMSRRRPSLVLLDEVLPGESSFDFLQEVIKEGTPVILITGMEDPTHEIPAGAALRISKPGWKSLDEDCKRFEEVFNRTLLKKK